jgi:hypothetical protein
MMMVLENAFHGRPRKAFVFGLSERVVQWVGGNGVALEDDPTWLAPVSPALRRDDALLVLHRLTHDRLAVLEHHVLVPKGVAPGFFFFPFSYFLFF